MDERSMSIYSVDDLMETFKTFTVPTGSDRAYAEDTVMYFLSDLTGKSIDALWAIANEGAAVC